MTPDEIVEFIERMVAARVRGDRAAQIDMLDGLLRGPTVDSLSVAMTLAATMAVGAQLEPGETFHRLNVVYTDPDGVRRPGSATDLPPHIATFTQMVVAMKNDDRSMATDLFIGYVGDDGRHALKLILFGLNQVLHRFGACSCQRRGQS